jgi:hypothetical protein
VLSVEAGATRHEAAEQFEVSVSCAIRWMQRFVQFGNAAAKPSGGHVGIGSACALVSQVDRRVAGFNPLHAGVAIVERQGPRMLAMLQSKTIGQNRTRFEKIFGSMLNVATPPKE